MMHCIVTRPAHQSQSLINSLHAAGYETIALPCVDIEPEISNPDFIEAMKQLKYCDIAIFLSANAARISLQHWPTDCLVVTKPIKIAIGPATAKQMQTMGAVVAAVANPPSSEGLLTMTCFDECHIKDKQVTLFCGYDPKPLLAEQLVQRGAAVRYAYCYRRLCPALVPSDSWQGIAPEACVISTSMALLKNLIAMVPQSHHADLYQHPLIVISSAMRNYAHAVGFISVYQAQDASDQAILTCLKTIES